MLISEDLPIFLSSLEDTCSDSTLSHSMLPCQPCDGQQMTRLTYFSVVLFKRLVKNIPVPTTFVYDEIHRFQWMDSFQQWVIQFDSKSSRTGTNAQLVSVNQGIFSEFLSGGIWTWRTWEPRPTGGWQVNRPSADRFEPVQKWSTLLFHR